MLTNCLVCNAPLEESAGRVGRKAKYCSAACRERYRQLRLSQEKTEHTCQHCGKALTAKQVRVNSVFCSYDCSHAATMTLKGTTRSCVICGEQFTPKSKLQQCCSSKCAAIKRGNTNKRQDLYVCKHCGRSFIPKAADRLDYCSRECFFASIHHERTCPQCGKPLSESQKYCSAECYRLQHQRQCQHCGAVFVSERPAKWCSEKCRYQALYVSARESNEFITKTCAHCGHEFSVNFCAERRAYCSDRCARRAAHLTRNHRHRQSVTHPKAKHVNRQAIFQRDNYTCQLCHLPVDPDLPASHPMSATLDHIVPLANGGWHAEDNVQLAHLICNSRKGASSPE